MTFNTARDTYLHIIHPLALIQTTNRIYHSYNEAPAKLTVVENRKNMKNLICMTYG